MVELFNKETNAYLGSISDEDLQFLIDMLEEDGLSDTDYYINQDVFEYLKEKGMSQALSSLLEFAMSRNSGEIEITYKKKSTT